MVDQKEKTIEYICPGENYSISRSVHLGRLTRFYPRCRQCQHLGDTGMMSARHVARLEETWAQAEPRPLFYEEGAKGVHGNDLVLRQPWFDGLGATASLSSSAENTVGQANRGTHQSTVDGALGPAAAREMAAALGKHLRSEIPGSKGLSQFSCRRQYSSHLAGRLWPVAVIAGDGRSLSAELVAAVSEGLRRGACHVIDIGPASTACLMYAIDHLQAHGGIHVGNPGFAAHAVGLKFFSAAARPLSAGGSLEAVQQYFGQSSDRPARRHGALTRVQMEELFLNARAPYYYAMRPLRVVLDSACLPLAGYLTKLTRQVDCRIISCRTTLQRLSEKVTAEKAHCGFRIEGDGETCLFFDEQGRQVPWQRIFLLLARQLLAGHPRGVVVLEDTTPQFVRQIESLGASTIKSSPRREQMAAAVQKHHALMGGGPSGRFWYSLDTPPLPDALMSVTILFKALSQSDRSFSEILDVLV
jgi:phosphomannomutase